MASALHLVLLAAATVLLVPALTLLAQVLASLRAALPAPTVAGRSPPLAVLIPAHDEALGLGATLASVADQIRPGDRVLVVADNCTDRTADVARAAGAEVVERFDAVRRGKGYALDAGVQALALPEPPEVVVVVDADCLLERDALDRLARLAAESGRPVQAAYRMLPPPRPSLRQRISAFAWVVRNLVRPTGSRRLGWPCQLMGTGMAFPWTVITTAPLASGHLVEDLQLGVALARAGTPPLFCAEAGVTSTFPTDEAVAAVQRTRWEHGHLSILLREAPRLLATAIGRGKPGLVGMALDLAVPPLALLVALLSALTVASSVAGFVLGFVAAPALAAGGLALVAVAVAVAARTSGRGLVSAADLLRVPLYIAGKLPLYGRWLRKRESSWIRTRR